MNRQRKNLVVAFFVGALLAWLAINVMGVLAAIAIPMAFLEALKGHPTLAFLLHTTLLVQIPVALLAALVGVLLFRTLREASLALVLVSSVPWLASAVVYSLEYYLTAELPPMVKLRGLFAWQAWPGLLSVPVGLWLASKFTKHGATNAL